MREIEAVLCIDPEKANVSDMNALEQFATTVTDEGIYQLRHTLTPQEGVEFSSAKEFKQSFKEDIPEIRRQMNQEFNFGEFTSDDQLWFEFPE